MFSMYLIFTGVMLSIYDTKQINCFKCDNYDHSFPKGDDLLPIPVKRSYGKKLLGKNSISCVLREVITL